MFMALLVIVPLALPVLIVPSYRHRADRLSKDLSSRVCIRSPWAEAMRGIAILFAIAAGSAFWGFLVLATLREWILYLVLWVMLGVICLGFAAFLLWIIFWVGVMALRTALNILRWKSGSLAFWLLVPLKVPLVLTLLPFMLPAVPIAIVVVLMSSPRWDMHNFLFDSHEVKDEKPSTRRYGSRRNNDQSYQDHPSYQDDPSLRDLERQYQDAFGDP